jgi:hypothetical protein
MLSSAKEEGKAKNQKKLTPFLRSWCPMGTILKYSGEEIISGTTGSPLEMKFN